MSFTSNLHRFVLCIIKPIRITCGVLSLAMLVTHGANWLQMKTTAALRDRARAITQIGALVTLITFDTCRCVAFFSKMVML